MKVDSVFCHFSEFIISRSSLAEFLGTLVYSTMSYANRDSFNSSHIPAYIHLISVSCLIAPENSLNTILKRSEDSGCSCLIPNFRGIALSCSPFLITFLSNSKNEIHELHRMRFRKECFIIGRLRGRKKAGLLCFRRSSEEWDTTKGYLGGKRWEKPNFCYLGLWLCQNIAFSTSGISGFWQEWYCLPTYGQERNWLIWKDPFTLKLPI